MPKTLLPKGYDIQFGARPLKRARNTEDELAEMIIRATVQEGDTIVGDFDKGRIVKIRVFDFIIPKQK